jgi:hypothetical protein
MGGNLDQVLILAEADRRAQRPVKAHELGVWDLRRRVQGLQSERAPGNDLPVDGRDIMKILGIAQGPQVGEAKAFLLEEALKRRRRMTRSEAAGLLLKWIRAGALRGASIPVDKPPPA